METGLFLLWTTVALSLTATSSPFEVEQWDVFETSFETDKQYARPFVDVEVDVVFKGKNALLQHGFLQVSADRRHFEHADGTPFLWLGDTWWKCLYKRMTWEGFQELAADRQAKGFSVVQIVCGRYPDEGAFEARWEHEGGKPYADRSFTVSNPAYFEEGMHYPGSTQIGLSKKLLERYPWWRFEPHPEWSAAKVACSGPKAW